MVRILTFRRRLCRTAFLASLTIVTACSAPYSNVGPVAADSRLDPTERVVRLHVAVAELRDDPDAAGAAIELSRAETWVARAEALARTRTDPELRDLLLETAEGQITMVRSHVALRRGTRLLHERGRPAARSGPRDSESPELPLPSGAEAPKPAPPAPNEAP